MLQVFEGGGLAQWVDTHASPLNLICTEPLVRNYQALIGVAEERGLALQIYFARKANKCLSLLDTLQELEAGLDVVSLEELSQVLHANWPRDQIICTAAIKTRDLLACCVAERVMVSIDNEDELTHLLHIVQAQQHARAPGHSRPPQPIALRVSGIHRDGRKEFSRFGIDCEAVVETVRKFWTADAGQQLVIRGLHFHSDKADIDLRVAAIVEMLRLVAELRALGHPLEFIDIGGGIPLSYLDSATEWESFLQCHRQSLLADGGDGQPTSPTFQRHGLGWLASQGQLLGQGNYYPSYRAPVQGDWLAEVLDARVNGSRVATRLRDQQVELRCQPGRSLLDGCGMSVARVESRKRLRSGEWLIGLAMNRTQCRTTHDDFLVDPVLLPAADEPMFTSRTPAMDGFLVGAYCTEVELLSWRRLRFPSGVGLGDLIVFPNTAGYYMHFMESRGHQMPLARNLIIDAHTGQPVRIDPSDAAGDR